MSKGKKQRKRKRVEKPVFCSRQDIPFHETCSANKNCRVMCMDDDYSKPNKAERAFLKRLTQTISKYNHYLPNIIPSENPKQRDNTLLHIHGNLSRATFLKKYFRKEPVLIKGLANFWPAAVNKDNCDSTRRWTRAYMNEKFGSTMVYYGDQDTIPTDDGRGTKTCKLSRLLGCSKKRKKRPKKMKYLFDSGEYGSFFTTRLGVKALEDIVRPAYFDSNHLNNSLHKMGYDIPSPLLILGTGGTHGVPAHAHADGWNVLLAGIKVWFIYPPSILKPLIPWQTWCCKSKESDYSYQMLRRVNRTRDAYANAIHSGIGRTEDEIEEGMFSTPYVLIQNVGDLLYVPKSWWHATIGLGETVSIAEVKQFSL